MLSLALYRFYFSLCTYLYIEFALESLMWSLTQRILRLFSHQKVIGISWLNRIVFQLLLKKLNCHLPFEIFLSFKYCWCITIRIYFWVVKLSRIWPDRDKGLIALVSHSQCRFLLLSRSTVSKGHFWSVHDIVCIFFLTQHVWWRDFKTLWVLYQFILACFFGYRNTSSFHRLLLSMLSCFHTSVSLLAWYLGS